MVESGSGKEIYRTPRSLMEILFGWNSLARRVLRLEINSIIPHGENLIAVKKGAIIIKRPEDNKFNTSFKIERGSRPLNLCRFEDKVYWGEYFSNPSRSEVLIYSSKNGIEWEVAYAFAPGRIRHVHGIYKDPFRKGIWVLTGDSDHESGLWFTNNHFKTLECVISGSQKCRAVSIIPLEDRIIVPMDSPKEINFIQSFYPEEKTFRALKRISGSAFYSYNSSSVSMISTVVEPSEINLSKAVEIWASLDRKEWIRIAKLRMDLWASISLKIFRYPEVRFPESEDSDPDSIKMFCSGTRHFGNNQVVLDKALLIEYLKSSQVDRTDMKNP